MKKLLCLINININNIHDNKIYNLWLLLIKELLNNTIITIDEYNLLLSIHDNKKIINYIQYMKSYISSNNNDKLFHYEEYKLFFYDKPEYYIKGLHYLNIPIYNKKNKKIIISNLINYVKLFKINISNIHLYYQYNHIFQYNENKILLYLLNSLEKCCNNNEKDINDIILLLINTKETPYKKLTHEGQLWSIALSKDMKKRNEQYNEKRNEKYKKKQKRKSKKSGKLKKSKKKDHQIK